MYAEAVYKETGKVQKYVPTITMQVRWLELDSGASVNGANAFDVVSYHVS